MEWKVGISGKPGTIWEGAVYPVTIKFSPEYPTKPPKCQFPAGFYHPNVYPSGTVCLSILNEEQDWRPAITLKQIVLGIQQLLDEPNQLSPAQSDAYQQHRDDPKTYERRVRAQAQMYAA